MRLLLLALVSFTLSLGGCYYPDGDPSPAPGGPIYELILCPQPAECPGPNGQAPPFWEPSPVAAPGIPLEAGIQYLFDGDAPDILELWIPRPGVQSTCQERTTGRLSMSRVFNPKTGQSECNIDLVWVGYNSPIEGPAWLKMVVPPTGEVKTIDLAHIVMPSDCTDCPVHYLDTGTITSVTLPYVWPETSETPPGLADPGVWYYASQPAGDVGYATTWPDAAGKIWPAPTDPAARVLVAPWVANVGGKPMYISGTEGQALAPWTVSIHSGDIIQQAGYTGPSAYAAYAAPIIQYAEEPGGPLETMNDLWGVAPTATGLHLWWAAAAAYNQPNAVGWTVDALMTGASPRMVAMYLADAWYGRSVQPMDPLCDALIPEGVAQWVDLWWAYELALADADPLVAAATYDAAVLQLIEGYTTGLTAIPTYPAAPDESACNAARAHLDDVVTGSTASICGALWLDSLMRTKGLSPRQMMEVLGDVHAAAAGAAWHSRPWVDLVSDRLGVNSEDADMLATAWLYLPPVEPGGCMDRLIETALALSQ